MRSLRGVTDVKFEYKDENFYYFTGWSKKESAVSANIFQYKNQYYEIRSSSLVGENLKTFCNIDKNLETAGKFHVMWTAYQLIAFSPKMVADLMEQLHND